MKSTIILRTAASYLVLLQLAFSLFLLLRGHNLPGGGFAGGLIAAATLALYAIAYGPAGCRRLMRINPLGLIPAGLLLAFAAGALPLILGKPFLDQQHWISFTVPVLGELSLSTTLLFDTGVYLLVIGAVITFLLNFQESDQPWNS